MFSRKQMAGALAALMFALAIAGCSSGDGGMTPEKTQGNADTAKAGADNCATSCDFKITKWGPQETRAGEAFNPQPDGGAAFWFHVDRSLEGSDAVVELEGQGLPSAISGNVITASVPASAYANPGVYKLHVTLQSGGSTVHSNDVKFVVH